MAVLTPAPLAWAKSRRPANAKLNLNTSKSYTFKKNGKDFVVTKEMNEQGRLIRQAVVGAESVEVVRDLSHRGVFDYWHVEHGDVKMTATQPLLGIYRRLEVQKLVPLKGIQHYRFAYSDKRSKYFLVEKSFEKAEVLNRSNAEVATVFAGGAIVDDPNKSCGMKSQGYANELWEVFQNYDLATQEERKEKYLRNLGVLKERSSVHSNCGAEATQVIFKSMADIAITADQGMTDQPPRFLSCMEKLQLSANASNIANVLATAPVRLNPIIRCDSKMSELGNYSNVAQPPRAPITLNQTKKGKVRSEDEIRTTLFHELVHMSGVSDENLTYAIQNCCSPPADKFDFNSSACNVAKDKVEAIRSRQKIQNLLGGPAGGEDYTEFVELVRKDIAPRNESENTTADSFNIRSDKIFQEEYAEFKTKIGKDGSCNKASNKTTCELDARDQFRESYRKRIASTCEEGTYSAAIQDNKLNSTKACKEISDAAETVASRFADVLSEEDYNKLCTNTVASKPIPQNAPSVDEKGTFLFLNTKSSVAFGLFTKAINSCYAADFSSGSNKLGPAMSVVDQGSRLLSSKPSSKLDLIGKCSIAADCYNKTSSVVDSATTGGGYENSRNSASESGQNQRYENGLGQADSDGTGRNSQAKVDNTKRFDPASPSTNQDSNKGAAAEDNDIKRRAEPSDTRLADTKTPTVPGFSVADSSGAWGGEARTAGRKSDTQIESFERSPSSLSQAYENSYGGPRVVPDLPSSNSVGSGSSQGSTGLQNVSNQLDPVMPDPAKRTRGIVDVLGDLVASTAYAANQDNAGERLRQMTRSGSSTEASERANSNSSSGAKKSGKERASESGSEKIEVPSEGAQNFRNVPVSNQVTRNAPAGPTLGSSNGVSSGAVPAGSAAVVAKAAAASEPGVVPDKLPKKKTERDVASVATDKIEKKDEIVAKDLENPEALSKFLSKSEPAKFEKGISKIASIAKLVELKIQWIRSDGRKFGSMKPVKVIEFDKDQNRYVMRDAKSSE